MCLAPSASASAACGTAKRRRRLPHSPPRSWAYPAATWTAPPASSLEADGFGPGYKLPGLPHRTGHGIGLDIHEWPYLVGNDTTPLDVGMCFSNEPMICIPGEFGIRHEDHFYMTENGPRWFTRAGAQHRRSVRAAG